MGIKFRHIAFKDTVNVNFKGIGAEFRFILPVEVLFERRVPVILIFCGRNSQPFEVA